MTFIKHFPVVNQSLLFKIHATGRWLFGECQFHYFINNVHNVNEPSTQRGEYFSRLPIITVLVQGPCCCAILFRVYWLTVISQQCDGHSCISQAGFCLLILSPNLTMSLQLLIKGNYFVRAISPPLSVPLKKNPPYRGFSFPWWHHGVQSVVSLLAGSPGRVHLWTIVSMTCWIVDESWG